MLDICSVPSHALSRRTEANQLMERAITFAANTQLANGCWEETTDPRIFDTAIVVICLTSAGLGDAVRISQAQHWLSAAVPQNHDPFAAAVETWLQKLAIGTSQAPPPLCIANDRALLLDTLTVCSRSPNADPARLHRIAVNNVPGGQLKQWQRALLAAASVISAQHLGLNAPLEVLVALEQDQQADGSICDMPAITALACTALAGTGRPSARRAVDYLARRQQADGTWRYLSFDIWDTTLMLRSLRGVPAFDQYLLGPAVDFILKNQSLDGGWACRSKLESDNDTTASAILALADIPGTTAALSTAADYLQRVQRRDGLWLTWQSNDDRPAQDVAAHVAAAMAAARGTIDTGRAIAWLENQYIPASGWTAQWYPCLAYGVAEVGAALGWYHDRVRQAALNLLQQQRPDGGWSLFPQNERSSTAATGLALTVLARSGIGMDHALDKAVAYLAANQTLDGTWPGAPIMAGPRPFLNYCPRQTHAFVAAGLRDIVLYERA